MWLYGISAFNFWYETLDRYITKQRARDQCAGTFSRIGIIGSRKLYYSEPSMPLQRYRKSETLIPDRRLFENKPFTYDVDICTIYHYFQLPFSYTFYEHLRLLFISHLPLGSWNQPKISAYDYNLCLPRTLLGRSNLLHYSTTDRARSSRRYS